MAGLWALQPQGWGPEGLGETACPQARVARLPLLLLQVGEAGGPGERGPCPAGNQMLGWEGPASSELLSGRGLGPSGPLRPRVESILPKATQ